MMVPWPRLFQAVHTRRPLEAITLFSKHTCSRFSHHGVNLHPAPDLETNIHLNSSIIRGFQNIFVICVGRLNTQIILLYSRLQGELRIKVSYDRWIGYRVLNLLIERINHAILRLYCPIQIYSLIHETLTFMFLNHVMLCFRVNVFPSFSHDFQWDTFLY